MARRPRLTKAAVDGLDEVLAFATADYEDMTLTDEDTPRGHRLARGIAYLEALIDWHRAKMPRNPLLKGGLCEMSGEQLGRGPCPECFNEHDATFQISRLRQQRDDLREALAELMQRGSILSSLDDDDRERYQTLANLNKTDPET